jgi:hypothetical protein
MGAAAELPGCRGQETSKDNLIGVRMAWIRHAARAPWPPPPHFCYPYLSTQLVSCDLAIGQLLAQGAPRCCQLLHFLQVGRLVGLEAQVVALEQVDLGTQLGEGLRVSAGQWAQQESSWSSGLGGVAWCSITKQQVLKAPGSWP